MTLDLSSSDLVSISWLVANHRNQWKVKKAMNFPRTRLSVVHKGWKIELGANGNSSSQPTRESVPCSEATMAVSEDGPVLPWSLGFPKWNFSLFFKHLLSTAGVSTIQILHFSWITNSPIKMCGFPQISYFTPVITYCSNGVSADTMGDSCAGISTQNLLVYWNKWQGYQMTLFKHVLLVFIQ